MKIIKNTSCYDSKKLQQLFCFIHTLIAEKEGRLKHWKTLQVEIKKTSWGYTGWAYIGRVYFQKPDMLLRLSNSQDLEALSNLFAHELMHSFGYKHKDMLNKHTPLTKEQHEKIQNRFKNFNFLKEIKENKIDYVSLRKQKAENNLSKWISKLNFAKNKVKKYQRQVNYYNK